MIHTSLAQWTKEDLERLKRDAVTEDVNLEYKSDLAVSKAKSGTLDLWHADQRNVGDAARYDLVKEIVALANTSGGLIIIGARESSEKNKPHTIEQFNLIPACIALAEVLRLGCRDLVESKLEIIEFRGIPFSETGEGVVLIRVPQSRLRPHRHRETRECYYRRSESSEPMTMEEIKDLTLNAVTQENRIEEAFARRLSKIPDLPIPSTCIADFWVRVVAIPLQPISLTGLMRRKDLHRRALRFQAFEPAGFKTQFFAAGIQWTPILRGIRSMGLESEVLSVRDIYEDGAVVLAFRRGVLEEDRTRIYPGWLLGLAANVLSMIDAVRQSGNLPDLPYGLHIEVETEGRRFHYSPGGDDFSFNRPPFPEGLVVLPRLQVGNSEEFDDILTTIDRDLWNCAGEDVQRKIKLNWATPAWT